MIAIALAYGSSSAVAQTFLSDIATCEVFERSVLISDSRGAGRDIMRDALIAYDRQAFALPDAVRQIGQEVPLCDELRRILAHQEGQNAALSALLGSISILAQVSRSATAPVEIFGHVPKLVAWEAGPFVPVATLSDGGGGLTAPALIPTEQVQIAGDFARALQFFLRGDVIAASRARPGAEQLDPLPRAWLSGIPTNLGFEELIDTRSGPAFDPLRTKSGGNAIALFMAVAEGNLSSASALRLSIPANNVLCIGQDGPLAQDVQWAGFVSGFWRTATDIAQSGTLRPDNSLSTLKTLFAEGESCFDAQTYALLERQDPQSRAGPLMDDLAILAEASFATSGFSAGRQRLAKEMLTAAAALAILRTEQEAATFGAMPGPSVDIGFLYQCTDPQTQGGNAIESLFDLSAPPGSPVATILTLANLSRSPSASKDRIEAASLAIADPAGDWLGGDFALLSLLERAAQDVSGTLGPQILDRYRAASQQPPAQEIVKALLELDDAAYAREIATFSPFLEGSQTAGIQLQSQVAGRLLLMRVAGLLQRLEAGDGDTASFLIGTPTEDRAYRRFINLFPRLVDQGYLNSLYRTNATNAVSVALIDLFHLSFNILEPNPIITFPGPERNPWLLFAPDAIALPEIAIAGEAGAARTSALIVAVSATVHALYEMGADGFAARETAQMAKLYGPAIVALDVAQLRWLDGVSDADTYVPTPVATRLFKDLTDAGFISQLLEKTDPLIIGDIAGGQFETAAGAVQLLWSSLLRPFLESTLAERGMAENADIIGGDVELGLRLAIALAGIGVEPEQHVAADLYARLRQGPNWPVSVRRLVAQLGLELLDPLSVAEASTDAQRLERIMAAFDAVALPSLRQNLIDAGLVPAAGAGVPLRLLVSGHQKGGLRNLRQADIADAFATEFAAYDFGKVAQTDGLAQFASFASAAMQVGLIDPQEPTPLNRAITDAFSGKLDAIMVRIMTYAADVAPSPEAMALAGLIALNQDLTALPDTGDVTDALDRVTGIGRICPRLQPYLGPVAAALSRRDGQQIDQTEAAEVLRTIASEGDLWRAAAIRSHIGIGGILTEVSLSQSPGTFPVVSRGGAFDLGFGYAFAARAWAISAAIGLENAATRQSPGFALALELAEDAAAAGDAGGLDRLLVQLESLALGGVPFHDMDLPGAAADIRNDTATNEFFGVRIGPKVDMSLRIGTVSDADIRLLRLARQADQLGLTALAYRVAGLGIAAALDISAQPPQDMIDPEISAAKAEALSGLYGALDGAVITGGYALARRIAAGVVPYPSDYADWAVCGGATPGCARLASPSDMGGTAPPFPCEAAARAALRGDYPAPSDQTQTCLHGPLGIDIQSLARPLAATPADTLKEFVGKGFGPISMVADPSQLQTLLEAAIGDGDVAAAQDAYGQAARLAAIIGDLNLAYQYALGQLMVVIANPANPRLDVYQARVAGQFAAYIGREDVQSMLQRLSQAGSRILPGDRDLAALILSEIQGQR